MDDNTTFSNLVISFALKYAELGWYVFPVYEDKQPALKWRKESTKDPERIKTWWTQSYRNCGIGIDCGKSNLAVIDVDVHKGAEIPENLPETAMQLTPSGGYHYVYAGKIKTGTSTIDAHVDTRSEGGYIVVEPSVFNKKGYHWEGSLNPLDGFPIANIPAWIVKKLKNGHREETSKKKVSERQGDIQEGERNDFLFRLACSWRAKHLSETAITAALHAENQARCKPPLPKKEVDRIAQSASGYEAGTSFETVQGGDDYEPDFEYQIEGLDLPRCQVFLDIMGFIRTRNFQDAPLLDYAGAKAFISTVLQGRYLTPTGGKLNRFVLSSAESGAGKDAAIIALPEIMAAIDRDFMLVGDLASASSLHVAMAEWPSRLWICDEIGDFFCTVGKPLLQRHIADIPKKLKSIYSAKLLIPPTFASKEYQKQFGGKIHNPAFSIFGATTPKKLMQALHSGEFLEDGFLNRFNIIHLNGLTTSKDADPTASIPSSLISVIKELIDPLPSNFVDFSTFEAMNEGFRLNPVCTTWGEGAEELWKAQIEEFLELRLDLMRQDHPLETYWNRAKLSTLVEATSIALLSGRQTITKDDLDYAAKVIQWEGKTLINLATQEISISSDPKFEQELKRVEKIIKKSGQEGVKHSALLRSSHLKARALNEIVATLIQSGSVLEDKPKGYVHKIFRR